MQTLLFTTLPLVFVTAFAYLDIEEFTVNLKTLRSEYHYIVVGAGSAGCRLANQLTSKKGVEVLLLEAGDVAPDFTEIPLMASLAEKADFDWDYQYEPQTHAFQAYVNKSKNYVAGKVLGGSSVMNYMAYQRGNRYDFDTWEKQFGAKDWGYDKVLPLFMADEKNTDNEVNQTAHGRNGRLYVSSTVFRTPFLEAFFKSTKDAGYPYRDVLDGNSRGVYHLQTTTGNGIRYSSAKAFIEPIIGRRRNFHLCLKSMVKKIIFEGNQAVGVEFEKEGSTHVVRASKEIILSAGAIRSPQLLMLSGIGPKEHLEKFNIPVIADLPVGNNLQDHIMNVGLLVAGPNHSIADVTNVQNLFHYFRTRTGPFASPSGLHLGVGYIDTKYASPEVPDIELFHVGIANDLKLIPVSNEINQEFYGSVNGDEYGYLIVPVLNHPRSTGTVRLQSANINDHPLIDPNFLADEHDTNTMVEGCKLGLNFIRSEHFKKIGVHIHEKPFPLCKQHEFLSDDYLRCVVKGLTFNIYHASGTCRMGDPARNDVVVDPQLRVKGIKNLRVADASIIPKIITGHLNAVCIMIGHKLGNMILEELN